MNIAFTIGRAGGAARGGPARAAASGLASAVAILVTFVVAFLVALGATLWLPPGRGRVDHLVLPVVLFPLVWTGLALGVYLAGRRRRAAWLFLGALGVAHGVALWLRIG